jgi:tRNA(Arg) A34 adenosine deaminase TadA
MQGSTVPDGVIRRAILAATETEGIKRYKLGAVLFDKRGRIINAKGNSRKTHPLLLRYSNYPYLHAESHCIVSHGLDNCRGLSLMVCRCDSSRRLTMARPCVACLRLIQEVGISKVYYTDWEGKIVENSS